MEIRFAFSNAGNLLEMEQQQNTQKNYVTKLIDQMQKQEKDMLKVGREIALAKASHFCQC
jgi:hypothetical protein